MQNEERRLILEMLSSGKISAEESIKLLEALGEPETGEAEAEEAGNPAPALDAAQIFTTVPDAAAPVDFSSPDWETASSDPIETEEVLPLQGEVTGEEGFAPSPGSETWRRFRRFPLLIGAGIVTAGALLMGAALLASGIGFWFFCASAPFLLGLTILVLAQGGRGMPWLHVRVKQPQGTWTSNIAISFPLPIRLAQWFLRTFGASLDLPGHISVGELLLLLEGVSPENPIYIEAGEEGEQVQVYIG